MKIDFREDYYVIIDDYGELAETPMGNVIKSKYKDLIEKVMSDLILFGDDPSENTSYYSLMASYLDFSLSTPPPALILDRMLKYDDDIFNIRSADPEQMIFVLNCFGRKNLKLKEYLGQLKKLSLRQLTSVIVASENIGSAIATLKIINGELKPETVSIGLCQHVYDKQVNGMKEKGYWIFDRLQKYEPMERDKKFCKKNCMGKNFRVVNDNCGVYKVLNKIVDFAGYPDEFDGSHAVEEVEKELNTILECKVLCADNMAEARRKFVGSLVDVDVLESAGFRLDNRLEDNEAWEWTLSDDTHIFIKLNDKNRISMIIAGSYVQHERGEGLNLHDCIEDKYVKKFSCSLESAVISYYPHSNYDMLKLYTEEYVGDFSKHKFLAELDLYDIYYGGVEKHENSDPYLILKGVISALDYSAPNMYFAQSLLDYFDTGYTGEFYTVIKWIIENVKILSNGLLYSISRYISKKYNAASKEYMAAFNLLKQTGIDEEYEYDNLTLRLALHLLINGAIEDAAEIVQWSLNNKLCSKYKPILFAIKGLHYEKSGMSSQALEAYDNSDYYSGKASHTTTVGRQRIRHESNLVESIDETIANIVTWNRNLLFDLE
jgi:hypothetical protein